MRADFFVSYTQADRVWAEWIAWELESAGYRVLIQAWDFRPGSNFVLEMQKSAAETDRTIAVVSQNYLDSMFAQPEWAAAFSRDPRGEARRLLLVRVEECNLSGLIQQLIYIDLVGLDEEEARSALLSGVMPDRAKPISAPAFPGFRKMKSTRSSRWPRPTESEESITSTYDVFLCHNSSDKEAVKQIARGLQDRGILPWLDEWEMRPGTDWQGALETQISNIKAAAVFIGTEGVGPWQDLEKKAFLQEFLRRACPVIPAVLPNYEGAPQLPPFLSMLQYVDFRLTEPDPIDQMIWGITGKKPPSHSHRAKEA
jgi:hypothetical protein